MKSANPELAAGDAGDDLVLHRQRRAGDAEPCIGSATCTSQSSAPVRGVERQERRVQRADEHPIAEHRDAAVERIDLVRVADLLRPLIAPDLPAGGGVERDDRPRPAAGVHDAVDDERHRLEHRTARQLTRPRRLQPAGIVRGDLLQAGIVRALVIAPVGQPVVRLAGGVPEALERQRRRRDRCRDPGSGYSIRPLGGGGLAADKLRM